MLAISKKPDHLGFSLPTVIIFCFEREERGTWGKDREAPSSRRTGALTGLSVARRYRQTAQISPSPWLALGQTSWSPLLEQRKADVA